MPQQEKFVGAIFIPKPFDFALQFPANRMPSKKEVF
jgi:hypothetical protein